MCWPGNSALSADRVRRLLDYVLVPLRQVNATTSLYRSAISQKPIQFQFLRLPHCCRRPRSGRHPPVQRRSATPATYSTSDHNQPFPGQAIRSIERPCRRPSVSYARAGIARAGPSAVPTHVEHTRPRQGLGCYGIRWYNRRRLPAGRTPATGRKVIRMRR